MITPNGQYNASPACFQPVCGLRSWLFARLWTGRWNPSQCRGTEGSSLAGVMHQRADLPGTRRKHPLSVQLGSALQKWAPSSQKWPSRSSALLSPSSLSLSGRHWLTLQGPHAISGLGWSLFRALRKPNVSGNLQLEVKSYLYCSYFFTHNACSTFRNIPSCESMSGNNV